MRELIVILSIVASVTTSKAQGLTLEAIPNKAIPHANQISNLSSPSSTIDVSNPQSQISNLKSQIPTTKSQISNPSAPFAFNPNNLPFFCKIEYNMIKGKKLPVLFRLGDLQYVNEMENKAKN